MVYDAKWSLSHDRHIFREESSDGVYLRKFDLFVYFHTGEDTSKCLREHRLSTSRRTLHEYIVTSCCGDEERAFRLLLPMDRREIYPTSHAGKCLYIESLCLRKRDDPCEHIDEVMETLDADNFDVRDDRCLRDIGHREKYISHTELSHQYRRRECSLDRSDRPVEGKFSEKKPIFRIFLIEINLFPKDTQSDREIIDRSFFL